MSKFFILFLGCILLNASLFAQANKKKHFVRQSGQVSVSYNWYDAQPVNYPNFRPRYESNILALNANYSIQVGKYFSLPFGIHISNRKKTYNLPELPQESIVSYVQNPRNNVHIDPTYRWVKLHLGSHTPQYSTLTAGDLQIFGAGIELTPGKFILSANYGKSQIAIEPDPVYNIQGAYRRDLMGARIGFGNVNGSKFTLNFVKVKDDASSVINHPIGIEPMEGVTVSPLIEFKLGKKIKIKTETAASIFTQNTSVDTSIFDEPMIAELSRFVTINAWTRADVAHQSRIDYRVKHFSIGGELKYVGPGYTPAGYYAMETDYLDYRLNTTAQLLEEKIDFRGTIGIRNNNVQKTVIQTTQRIIGSTSVNVKFSKAFSVRASYSNFGMNNNSADYYQRVEYVNNSISVRPSLKIKRKNIRHQISAGWKKGLYRQYDVKILDFTKRSTQSFNAAYRATLKPIPLQFGFTGLYIDNQSTISSFNMMNIGMNVGYKLLDKKLKPGLSVTYSKIQRTGYTPNNRINTKLKLKYKINKKLNIKMAYSLNWNRYGSYRPNAELTENKFQTTISQKF